MPAKIKLHFDTVVMDTSLVQHINSLLYAWNYGYLISLYLYVAYKVGYDQPATNTLQCCQCGCDVTHGVLSVWM